ASGARVSHTYAAAGSYTVRLTVTAAGQTASTTHVIVVALPALSAVFLNTPTHGAPGDQISFDGSRSTVGSGGTISSYTWGFGDGATASGVTAQHTYAAPGHYTVTLTVVDNAGQVSHARRQITIAYPGTPIIGVGSANLH